MKHLLGKRRQDQASRVPLAIYSEQVAGGALFLTIEQAAQLLGLSPNTLRSWRWRARAGLSISPAARRLSASMVSVGRSVRVPASAIQEFLSNRHNEVLPTDRTELRALLQRAAELLEAGGNKGLARILDGVLEAVNDVR